MPLTPGHFSAHLRSCARTPEGLGFRNHHPSGGQGSMLGACGLDVPRGQLSGCTTTARLCLPTGVRLPEPGALGRQPVVRVQGDRLGCPIHARTSRRPREATSARGRLWRGGLRAGPRRVRAPGLLRAPGRLPTRLRAARRRRRWRLRASGRLRTARLRPSGCAHLLLQSDVVW